MIRHFSAEVIGRLSEDDLGSRRAGRVRSHLARCARCSAVSRQLAGVTALLASTTAPPMPESLTARIESSLAVEVARRTAAAPQAEAFRRDLPERGSAARRGKPPRRSPAGLRVAAAAAAVAVVAGVSVAVLNSHGGSGGSAANSAPALAHGAAQGRLAMKVGPQLSFRANGRTDLFRPVSSHVGYTRANLVSQVSSALRHASSPAASAGPGVLPGQGGGASPGALGRQNTAQAPQLPVLNSFAGILTSALEGCVGRVAGHSAVLMVDVDSFGGKPATVIVLGAAGALGEQVWVVGPGCSAAATDVILHRVIAGG
ncbi:MAG TPA: hypothetical protein VGI64_08030 [Streptosporangiaceae bacterium]|jgi:hypothetical protein